MPKTTKGQISPPHPTLEKSRNPARPTAAVRRAFAAKAAVAQRLSRALEEIATQPTLTSREKWFCQMSRELLGVWDGWEEDWGEIETKLAYADRAHAQRVALGRKGAKMRWGRK